MNGLQDRPHYARRPVGNSPKFIPLDNSLNRDILHSFRFHCVLSRFLLDGREQKRKRGIYASVSLHRRKLPEDWSLYGNKKTETHSSARIIQDVVLALKMLEIVYRANGDAVEGLADRNGHIRKVLGEGKSASWGGAWNKGMGRECELTKNMFLHSDLLKLCLRKNTTSMSSPWNHFVKWLENSRCELMR